jgi:hypothetical protein
VVAGTRRHPATRHKGLNFGRNSSTAARRARQGQETAKKILQVDPSMARLHR